MSQTKIRPRTTLLLLVISYTALAAAGCDCPRRLRVLQRQNQILTEQIADLENQLMLADAQAAQAAPTSQTNAVQMQTPADVSVYTIVEGDSLWSIARKQLGKGSRYKEILALNPHISQDEPLAIGTKLKLPPR